MTPPDAQEFSGFRMTARAPRVAIVVRADEHWQFWCRLAIYQASQTWGGAGSVLVPHSHGRVSPALLAGVVAYDPDYVVLQRQTIGDVEALSPGSVAIDGDGPLSAEQRAEIVARGGDIDLRDIEGEGVRRTIAAMCSPYRRWEADDSTWDEQLLWWPDQGTALTPAHAVAPLAQSAGLGVRPDLTGSAPLMLAALVGYSERPLVSADGVAVTSAEQAQAFRWCMRPSNILDAPLLRGPALVQASAFDVGATGLTMVTVRGRGAPSTLLTVGDSADDFALSLMWDRVYGGALWVPASWTSPEAPESGLPQEALRHLSDRARRQGPLVTSTSLPAEQLTELLAAWTELSPSAVNPAQRHAESLDWPDAGRRFWAVDGHFDQRFELPVRRTPDGSRTMSTPPPLPMVAPATLPQSAIDNLKWEVDLEIEASSMPRGRGFDAHTLFADLDDAWSTWMRSSSNGLSYNAHRYDLVLTGSSWSARLARPRIRDLGLLAWARAMGGVQHRGFRHSDAGLRVQVLERMIGRRDRLLDLASGPLLPALREFQNPARASRDAFPEGDGVRLIDGAYLTFGAFLRLVDRPDIVVRGEVDTLGSAGFLRRGVVLGCATCGRVSFLTVDELGNSNRCPRCGAQNNLTRERWRSPVNEPQWFYDLHPVARELFLQHGDVPLLAAAHLRARAKTYTDVAELEMLSESGNPVAEADLLAHADGEVIVVEAKSNDALGGNTTEVARAVRKRVALAQVLSADEVVLATTAPSWASGSVQAMASALSANTWRTPKVPRLRLLTGLGTATARDQVIES